ncbi:MAG: hypothetical protein MJZ13_08085 [Bacteroidales bacterium]|nr:hypothetical protein [Bacteroidales bacterium]
MNILKYATIGAIALLLTSCSTKEEKYINNLRSLTEEIENCGDNSFEYFTHKLESIDKNIDTDSYDFTDEQLLEIEKLQARFVAQYTKMAAKQAGKTIRDALNNGEDLINGFLEGLKGE